MYVLAGESFVDKQYLSKDLLLQFMKKVNLSDMLRSIYENLRKDILPGDDDSTKYLDIIVNGFLDIIKKFLDFDLKTLDPRHKWSLIANYLIK